MSTTFDVFPCKEYIPTFGEVIELANSYLDSFLNSIEVKKDFQLMVNLHKQDESFVNNHVLLEEAKWEDGFYSWFYINGVSGGTDSYYRPFDEEEIKMWKEEIETNPQFHKFANKLNKSIEVGYSWSFRRSAGQPGIIVLSYGLIAAAFAKLTDGLIYSDDGAWDYSLFPAEPNDFLTWYFRPDRTTDNDSKEWAERCIQSIYEELKKS